MVSENVSPLTAEQLLSALRTLGAETVLDPEHHEEGDVPMLLGDLLAVVERETAARVDTGEDPPVDLSRFMGAWRDRIGRQYLAETVLVHRTRRTLYDWSQLPGNGDVTDPLMRVLLAAQALLGARAARDADPTGLRMLREEAECELAEALAELRRARSADGPA
ncbi:hypothetical protein O4J56_03660 [Nocardiopsis sp. RSe5-2]|uniref:Uncharacterized protein n=1 Tax=Nocardiopsis endophytica TaxID=3018445 RepID=A0ABT4U037_9ACTN|nr:hypothetical protein [Nocardiopsis endophytica]MDA2809727.1 hypothetical protein [Nocardiopsis endophytica]